MYSFLRPLLFRLDAERAHNVSLRTAELMQSVAPSLIEPRYSYEDERLKQRLWGETFPNPVGLAAGVDKDARLVPFWEAVGLGFVEVGSVSAMASDGNPKPRAFRLPDDQALLNRMGLNNEGAATVAERIEDGRNDRARPLGINLVKTHDPGVMGEAALEDFRESFRLLAPQASYVVLNVSCPNTEGGRTFEDPRALDDLLDTVFSEQKAPGLEVPVLIKLSPPISERVVFDTRLEDIVTVAQSHGVHGFVASNTMDDRSDLQTPAEEVDAMGEGGISGPPLADRATCLVRYLYRVTDGECPIIGVGGVRDADSAYQKIRAGASLVQLYTALVYEGPALVKRIKEGLVERLREDGHVSIADAVGADA